MSDQGTYSGLPLCGPFAVAKLAGVEVSSSLRRIGRNRGPNWKGRSNIDECLKALKYFGVRVVRVNEGLGMSLERWVDQHATPSGNYFVRTGGHILAVKRRMVFDQAMAAEAWDHRSKNKRVTHAYRVLKKGERA